MVGGDRAPEVKSERAGAWSRSTATTWEIGTHSGLRSVTSTRPGNFRGVFGFVELVVVGGDRTPDFKRWPCDAVGAYP